MKGRFPTEIIATLSLEMTPFITDMLHSIWNGTLLNSISFLLRSGKLTLCNEGGHGTTSKVSCPTHIRQKHVQSSHPQYDDQCLTGVRTRKPLAKNRNINRSHATVARTIYKYFKV